MAYCKKWIPPTIPLRDNLAAWKTLFTDLHDNMIAAGLVKTDTVGQLKPLPNKVNVNMQNFPFFGSGYLAGEFLGGTTTVEAAISHARY